MVDYVTLTLNSEMITNAIWVFYVLAGTWVIFTLIDMIKDAAKENRKREIRIMKEPYRKEYMKLLDKGTYKEALAYAEKHRIHMGETYY